MATDHVPSGFHFLDALAPVAHDTDGHGAAPSVVPLTWVRSALGMQVESSIEFVGTGVIMKNVERYLFPAFIGFSNDVDLDAASDVKNVPI